MARSRQKFAAAPKEFDLPRSWGLDWRVMRLLPPASVALAIALTYTSVPADSVTLSPSADTCLFEFLPDFNWGAEPELVAGVLTPFGDNGRARILMEFDIAGNVPAGSTITSAQLTMTAVKAPPDPASGFFHLLRIFVDWSEGVQDGASNPGGATAVAGETSWNNRIVGAPPNWQAPGGRLEDDFAEDPSASAFIGGQPSGDGQDYVFNFTSEGILDLQSMLSFPDFNHGWVLLAQAESIQRSARRWASREHPTDPPQLEITFTPPAPPPVPDVTATSVDLESGELEVEVAALSGLTYTLETSPTPAGPWTPTDVQAAITDGTLTLGTTPPAGTKRLFFRISVANSP